MVPSSSVRLRLSVVGLVGFLFACGGNGGNADAGTGSELADPERSSVTVTPSEQVPADGDAAAVVTVTLKDSGDKVMAEHPVQVMGADLQVEPSDITNTDASGVASFLIRSVVPGPKVVKVFVNPGTASEQLLAEKSVTFSALPVPYLAFEQQPTAVVAGATLSPVKVKFVDAQGATVSLTETVTLKVKNSDAELFGTTSVAAVNGVATFSNLSVWKAGAGLVLEASSPNATSNSSTPFNVTPAVATGFAFRGNVPNGTVRAHLAAPTGVVVELVDTYGNTGATVNRNVNVRISLEGGVAGAELGGTLDRVAAPGESVVAFNDLSIDTEGSAFALTVEEMPAPQSGAIHSATSNTFTIADDLAPAMPGAFASVDATQTTMTLSWTAPGDDALQGELSGYELRYATTMLLTEQDFLAATEVAPGPQPASVNATQTFVVTGLDPDTLYYFGLRAKDGAGNLSVLAVTSGPTLPDGCAPVNPCTEPPAATCDGNTAVTYAATATCSPASQNPWFECAAYEPTETACTGGTPYCLAGGCVATLCPADIDDNDACTADACDPATGVVTHVAVALDDGNACTVDACDSTSGAITHQPVAVDDNDACTVDSCDTATGAIAHTAVPVDDSDACTVDACDPTTGVSHTAVAVDDSVACTVDLCDPVTGVSHTPNDGACGQGETCSAIDGCVGTADPCNGFVCTPPADGCSADHLSVVSYTSACDSSGGTAQCVNTLVETACGTNSVCVAGACTPARAPAAGELQITEVMHSPSTGTTEYFELYNSSSERLNVAGLTVSLGQGNASFTLSSAPVLVEANAFIVFAHNTNVATNGGVTAHVELPAGFTLENAGQLELSLSGTSLSGLTWTASFPQAPGRSMDLSNVVFSTTASAHAWYWCDSANALTGGDFGTPGFANESCGITAPTAIGWCNTQHPQSADWTGLNRTLPVSQDVYSRLWTNDVTTRNTSGNDYYPHVEAEFGYGTVQDALQWSWSAASFNAGWTAAAEPNNDELQGNFAPAAAGIYSYGFRYRLKDPVAGTFSGWAYCDQAGLADPTNGSANWTTVTIEEPAAPAVTIDSVDYPVIAHGARLVLTGVGFTGATGVTVGGQVQAFSVSSDTQIVIASLDDATPVGTQPVIVSTPAGSSAGFNVTAIHLVINELDADQSGTDAAEFVEISTGVPNVNLAGYTLVFWNGSIDQSYFALALNAETDANGLLLVGNPGMTPTPALTFTGNSLQNGQDAVSLHQAPTSAFPNNTPVAGKTPIDAVVYGSPTDPGLLDALIGSDPARRTQPADPATQSSFRCGSERRHLGLFSLGAPTPGQPNTCP